MNLSGKINALAKRLKKLQPDADAVPVAVGVWYCTAEGEIIEGSGKTMLAPKNRQHALGMTLVRRPAASKFDAYAEFEAEIKKCNEYQARLNEKHTQSI